MNKRQVINGPSCLTRANEDEPVFVLRANDALAPPMIRRWAHAYLLSKGGITLMTSEQLGKYNDALRVAIAMEAYRSKVEDNRRFNAPNIVPITSADIGTCDYFKPKRQL